MFLHYSREKRIFYNVKGFGTPLLFIPGWSQDHSVFTELIEHFSQHHKVVFFDPPGCGKSDRFEAYSFELTIEVVVKLLAELALEAISIIGWSMGGEIAVKAIAEKKIKAAALILVCSTPSFVQREDWALGMAAGAAKRFARGLKKSPHTMMQLFRDESLKGNKREEANEILLAAGKHTDLKCAEQMFEELVKYDLRKHLSRINVPTTIVSGKYDEVCSPLASIYMKEKIQHAQQIVLEAGHVPFLSDPREFYRQIKL